MHLTPPPPASGDDDGNGAGHQDDHRSRPSSRHWDDLPPLDVEVPDDLSELDDEIAAYHAELRSQRRRARLNRLIPGLRDNVAAHTDRAGNRPRSLPGMILVGFLIIIGTLGAMAPLVLTHPRPVPAQVTVPRASTTARAGTVGAPLPDYQLITGREYRAASDLRPALIVLLPATCDCANAIHDIVGQAREGAPVPTYLVAPRVDDPLLNELTRQPQAGGGFAVGYSDPNGSLARLFLADPEQPTLLLIAADGRLVQPPRVFHVGDRFEGWLGALPVR
ncbi:hypothetical protein [Frankia sp. Cppng1_Ct_nod]|uniref:hypothetical protein n=1 Tax=Frankia sp. Cppng1_Ct_nod TaxID=2897162 RepID=UPI0010411218|nr:hypothetical protein [Frankia sp. Cppng1_Ct_nod]